MASRCARSRRAGRPAALEVDITSSFLFNRATHRSSWLSLKQRPEARDWAAKSFLVFPYACSCTYCRANDTFISSGILPAEYERNRFIAVPLEAWVIQRVPSAMAQKFPKAGNRQNVCAV